MTSTEKEKKQIRLGLGPEPPYFIDAKPIKAKEYYLDMLKGLGYEVELEEQQK